ncbi:putative molybdenum carrier protein [Microbulbifer variabilis]|uniref:Molybdenum carrier protein n=1 Tax=Microbulbifer variabilis TaxID=266805 RepID=A0ABY4V6W8_9GAMM|nr:putative molybdenum carrier protein [Microbulbifer variabilis]USD20023.1 putative molybdenum carrier protein [Microbulbifer variabilis]
MSFKPEKIISGGQTGADTGGLIAGQRLGIATGGTAPQGYWTEAGERADFLKSFGLIELASGNLAERTRENIRNSDATLIFTDNPGSDGTSYTIKFCRELGKPFLVIDPWDDCCKQIRDFIGKNKPYILNVAGNRESNSQGITWRTAETIQRVFSG